MNRRFVVILTAAFTLTAFAVSAYRYSLTNAPSPPVEAAAEDDRLVRSYSPVLGPQEAPVTIVEFFDPACETCRAFHPLVKQIRQRFPTEVRVVVRYAAFHKGSDVAVRILETSRLQGKYEEVLEAILEAQPRWAAHHNPDLDKAWDAAAAVGLDLRRARNDMLLPGITATLNGDMADIRAIGVKKTPTFFVNGKPLTTFGAKPLIDLVISEVERTRTKGS